MVDIGKIANRRELKSILFADVAGYTRLMHEDEEATHERISGFVRMFEKECGEFGGEILEVRGDGVFAVFSSAADSVRFADKIQDAVEAHNQKYAEDRKIRFRIGIHLGDVVRDEKFHYGDSVNIAARIEGLADTGGICISSAVYQQVRNSVKFGYENLGLQRLKNIKEAVEVYRITKDTNTAMRIPSPRDTSLGVSTQPETEDSTVRPSER